MDLILNILFGALALASAVCSIIILVAAFQESVGKGLLCLCIPFYILYFAFAEFEPSSHKELILGLWLGPCLLSVLLSIVMSIL
jgi:benzodiazapine receptor